MSSQLEVFTLTELATALRKLVVWKRVAFMTYCCERMLPNYKRFSAESDFGDTKVLRQALDIAWEWMETAKVAHDLGVLSKECQSLAPNTETFTSRYTSAALDATSVVEILLESIEAFRENHPVEIASLARDTIDLFVQESLNLDPKDPEFEVKILRHELMQTELRLQRSSIEELEYLPEERVIAARKLRLEWANLSRGSLEEKAN